MWDFYAETVDLVRETDQKSDSNLNAETTYTRAEYRKVIYFSDKSQSALYAYLVKRQLSTIVSLLSRPSPSGDNYK